MQNERPSKTLNKKLAHEQQEWGEKLLALPPATLDFLPLSEELRAAFDEFQKIKAHGAKRRQLQLIGKIMRGLDLAAIQNALNDFENAASLAELWRDKILNDESALTEFLEKYENAPIQELRAARRRVLKTLENPAQNAKPRRTLFLLIKEAILQKSTVD